jgi:predicted NBD/HSP70 family sugar kinase
VARHAADIGRLVAGCVGMLDPGLIVLGGGVGQNPLMLREVRRVAGDLTWRTEIAVSSLGANGTSLGAMRLAADYGLGLILGEATHPAVVLPPLAAPGESAAAE